MKTMNRDPCAITQKLLPDLLKCGNVILNPVAVHSSMF